MNTFRIHLLSMNSRAISVVITMATWLAVLLLATSAWLANGNLKATAAASVFDNQLTHAQFVAETLLSTLKDAETGQRGYLLTGDVTYLAPYNAARQRLDSDFDNLNAAPLMTPQRVARIETIQALAARKLAELDQTIMLYQSGQTAAALDLVRSNQGKQIMDAIRVEVDMLQLDAAIQQTRVKVRNETNRLWAIVLVLACLAFALLAAVAWAQRRIRLQVSANLYQLERFTRAFGLVSGMMRSHDGRITYWSPGAERMYGYRSDQAVGQISHHLLQTRFTHHLPDIEDALSSSGFWSGELTHVHQNGSVINVVSTWTTHDGESTETTAIIEVNADVTNLKRAEAELRESEMKLRLALDASNQGVWQCERLDDSWHMIWDQRCKALFGLAPDDPVGPETWLDAMLEDDQLTARSAMKRALDPDDPDDDYVLEHRIRHHERDWIWVAATGRALFEPAPGMAFKRRAIRIVGTIRNISESKRLEEERQRSTALLHTIVATAPGLIYAKDLRGRMLLANASVLDLIGKSWNKVEGRTDAEFLDNSEQAQTVMLNDRRIMQLGHTERLEELVNDADGRMRVWASTKAPMAGPDGQVVGLVGVSVEITEQKHAQDQLRLMLNELNHRVKNTLATVMAISSQTLRGLNATVRESFESRLLALALAHDILTREKWEGASLRDVVAEALVPFDGWNAARFWISGPAVSLRPSIVLAVAMGLHELATNALKFGALSDPSGRIEIRWEVLVDAEPLLRLSWTERNGPKVVPPASRGFGLRLIERSLAQDLRGSAKVNFEDPHGVVCIIEAQLTEIVTSSDTLSFPRVGGQQEAV